MAHTKARQPCQRQRRLARLTGAHILVLRAVTPTPGWLLQEAALYDTGIYVDGGWDSAALVEARNYVTEVAALVTSQGVPAEGLALLGEVPAYVTDGRKTPPSELTEALQIGCAIGSVPERAVGIRSS